MPRRSKLDPYKDQILEWVRQGKGQEAIQALLKDRGVEITHQAVGNYIKKATAPMLAKVAEKATTSLDSMESIAAEALSKYAALIAKDEAEMTLGERNYFRTVGEWFDRIARLRGLYGPNSVTQVAVGVQVKQGDELREWAKRTLSEESQ